MPANTLPADFDGFDELPADFTFPEDGFQAPAATTIPAEQPRGWLEAFFPWTADAPDNFVARAAALGNDITSGPGRIYESSVPAWRAPGESFQQALGRTGPREDEGWIKQGTSRLLRDPANVPLAALTALTGGATAPAWLSRLGWAGAPLATGATMGAVVGATRQAENVAAGRPVDAMEAGKDVAVGAGLGAGGSILGRGLASFGRGAQTAGKQLLQSIIKPQGVDEIQGFERALGAGLLPEFAGYGTLTAQSAGKRFLGRLDDQAAAYEPALAAADATGQRVNASQVMRAARGDIAGKVAGGNLPVSAESAQRGIDWAGDIMAAPGSPDEVMARMAGITPERMARGPVVMQGGSIRQLAPNPAQVPQDVTLLPSVANRRKSGMWKEAFKSQDADQTARGAGALAAGRAANAELGKISPELADLNARLAPYYAGSDAALRAATTRGNQYFIGPMELWSAAAGGGFGSTMGLAGAGAGTLGAVLASRLARSPAFARSMYDAGRISEATYRALQSPGGQALGRALLAGATVAASPTDNARGGR